MRPQPAGAGFVFGTAIEPVSSKAVTSAAARQPSGPLFSALVPAKGDSGIARSGSNPKLPAADALAASAIGARSIPDRVRSLPADPRWKPLAAAGPTRPLGKIILVLGSFLRRPVRIAGPQSLPETFAIPFHPIPFPPLLPR